jgi:hypothetical protein
MADLPVPGSITPAPNVQMHKLWTQQQIAELECKIKHLEANREELVKARLPAIEAEIIGCKRKAAALMGRLDELEQFGLNDVIEVNGTTVKRLENQGGNNG